MAYRLRLRADWDWVPDGAGGAIMGVQQAENPAYGASPVPGGVGAAQTASDIVGELVVGGDSPSNANFQTALNAGAADLYTRMTTAGSVPGFSGTLGTLAATIQGWSTGNP